MIRTSIAERLRPIAAKYGGVIPVWAAQDVGVRADCLRRWASRRDDVDSTLKGVYVWYDENNPDINWDRQYICEALAWAGKDAWLWGPQVLELADLGTASIERTFFLGSRRRRRKTDWIRWLTNPLPELTYIHGLPCQPVKDALISASFFFDGEQLADAVDDAIRMKYITAQEGQYVRMKARAQWSKNLAR